MRHLTVKLIELGFTLTRHLPSNNLVETPSDMRRGVWIHLTPAVPSFNRAFTSSVRFALFGVSFINLKVQSPPNVPVLLSSAWKCPGRNPPGLPHVSCNGLTTSSEGISIQYFIVWTREGERGREGEREGGREGGKERGKEGEGESGVGGRKGEKKRKEKKDANNGEYEMNKEQKEVTLSLKEQNKQ